MTQVVSRNFGNQSRSKGKDFLTYFSNTYKSQGCQFPVTMWNQFDNNRTSTLKSIEEIQKEFMVSQMQERGKIQFKKENNKIKIQIKNPSKQ